MVALLFIVVVMCFIASILPFVFPGTILSALGVALNHWLGEFLVTTLKVTSGSLVSHVPGVGTVPGGVALTSQGVLLVYLPPLAALIFILRGR